MKRQLRCFIAAFLITSILMGGFTAFLLVDLSTDTYGLDEASPLFYSRVSSPCQVEVGLMGRSWNLPMEAINQAAGFLQEYDAMLLPRSWRLTGKLAAFGWEQYRRYEDYQRELDYQRAIA